MINTVEKAIFAIFAIIILFSVAVSMPIEVMFAVAGLFVAAYLVLNKEPVKQKTRKMIKRIKN